MESINNGKILDSKFDSFLIRDNIYPLFVNYFEDPVLTKVRDVNNFSMYACKIQALLGIEYRYLICFIRQDKNPVGSTLNLSDLSWDCIQTRTMTEDYNVNIHGYIPQRLAGLNKKIYLINKDEYSYNYNVDGLPFTVSLLPKTKNLDYLNTGSVINALETYQTIIKWTI
jgi:hypothetical protein